MSEATSPTNGYTNGDAVIQDPVNVAWQRYERLKDNENEKNKLIEELIWRYECVIQQNGKLSSELLLAKRFTTLPSLKVMEEQNIEMRKALDREPFILILIDADGMIFHQELLAAGIVGGRQTATMLEDSVNQYVYEVVKDLPPSVKIVARFYANLDGLSETCFKAGMVSSPQIMKDFAKGLTQGRTSFDFVDVGPGKDRADEKIIETFKLHAGHYQCRHIVLGCSHDNGFARLLENYVYDEFVQPRVTLLEGVPFEKELANIEYAKIRFGTLFQAQKLVVPSTLPPWAVLGSDFVPARNDVPARNENHTPSESVASGDAPIKAPLVTWANKAKAAAAMPDTPPVAKAVLAASPGASTGIPRNRKGQRVDPTCNFDKSEVDRVRKLKMCNVHYLRNECPYGDKCTHKHERIPTKSELDTLRVVARMAACRNGSSCEDAKCIYGHRCQAPARLDKAKWNNSDGGKTCIFGAECVFPGELHNIDTTIVKMVKV